VHDASAAAVNREAGHISNFETGGPDMTQLQSNNEHANLPDQDHDLQLDTTTTAEPACPHNGKPGDLCKAGLVKSTLPNHPLNAPPIYGSTFTATSQSLLSTPSVPLKVSPGKRVCEGGTLFQRHF
jgi:hypothetical protein